MYFSELASGVVACKTIYFAKLYVLHTKSTVPFVLACVYVLF